MRCKKTFIKKSLLVFYGLLFMAVVTACAANGQFGWEKRISG
jgi:hypothetical protein